MNLESVKPNDKIMCVDRRSHNTYRTLLISTVTRLTKTQVIIEKGGSITRIKKENGFEIGSSGRWNIGRSWELYNKAIHDEIKKEQLEYECERAKKTLGNSYRLDVLTKLINDLKE